MTGIDVQILQVSDPVLVLIERHSSEQAILGHLVLLMQCRLALLPLVFLNRV